MDVVEMNMVFGPGSQCCSKYGYSGKGSDYCGNGCKSSYGSCNSGSSSSSSSIISIKEDVKKLKEGEVKNESGENSFINSEILKINQIIKRNKLRKRSLKNNINKSKNETIYEIDEEENYNGDNDDIL
ncbi:hypothetical protein H8356DRAFT_923774 [Neocallimastix lanati (nom. inval.)]|uniref:Chitin-binding type-1 domain-containing protein n=1 Tax=Neocallimastix californiae TaxID=1754190 RepID=A0A1Y2AT53_9FUNG|nr:hypothetical protein H8356DRAFT_923774 [Neocallimastix sp. JGI-2020a]ORY25768.1 hypothetical protein LY90DRAFT_514024 [Neocallimastix californiae]|eukprot:ORY25768.1 hypothetical protein LY90DRAFT_514024 [Neocallimastix californiae]